MTCRALLSLLPLLPLTLGACSDDAKDDTSGADDSADTSDSAGGTYTLQGSAITFGPDRDPAPEGMCVTIFDPTDAISGGEPEMLASTTLASDASFQAELPADGAPLLIVIDDEPIVFPTGTPVQPEAVAGVMAGDTLPVTAVSLSVGTYDLLSAGLSAAGDTTDISTDGVLIAVIMDGADQSLIPTGTLSCGGCTVYYNDADPTDGLFSTGGVLNTHGGVAVVPGAPIDTYTAVADGYSFPSGTGGAIPRGALVAALMGTATN